MDKYICDESNGLWYELQGNYYIPCLILSEEETQPIGLWGQRHKQYLKEHKQFFYTTMYEFFQAALPWILLGLFVAVSCVFFHNRKK